MLMLSWAVTIIQENSTSIQNCQCGKPKETLTANDVEQTFVIIVKQNP